MRFLDKFKNLMLDIISIINKYDFINFPLIAVVIYFFIHENFKITDQLLGNFVNISSVFIGFLITIHSIIIALPKESKFMKKLIEYGYFKQMYLNILFGEVFLLICLLISLFNIFTVIAPIMLILGLINTILLSKTFFLVSFNA